MTEKEREYALAINDTLTVFALLVRCPTGGVPNSSCPFAPLRDKHCMEEKFRLAESLPEKKRREMLAFHKHCLIKNHVKVNTLDLLE